MLSPAFEPISNSSTLLPPLTPSSLARCRAGATVEPRAASAFPLSPSTPRARLSAVIAAATSPYFSPSNPFSIRARPVAACAKYALINTLPASPALATPSFRPHVHAEMGIDGSRTLRQRGRGDTSGIAHAAVAKLAGSTQRTAKKRGMGKTVLSLTGWVALGMLVSLAILAVRARMDSGLGGAGAVKWDEPELNLTMRARGDIWADDSDFLGTALHISGSYGGSELQGIWADEAI